MNMRLQRRALLGAIAGMGLFACACKGSTTDPSTDAGSDSDTPAAVTTTEAWEGVVPVGGAVFYSFSVGTRGTVSVTLLSVGGQFVPATVMLGLGIGTPDGTVCSIGTPTTAKAGSTPQVTGTYDPGVYCANVADIGNLFSTAAVSVNVEHP